MEDLLRNKKLLLYIILSSVGILIIWIMFVFLSEKDYAKITINTSSKQAKIRLTSYLNPQNPKILADQTGDKFEKRIPPGQYQIDVSLEEKSSRASLNVGKKESKTLDINLKSLKQVTNIGNYTATGINPRQDSLIFLNTPAEGFYKLSYRQSGAVPYLDDVYPTYSVLWNKEGNGLAAGNYGVNLYYIKNDSSKRISSSSINNNVKNNTFGFGQYSMNDKDQIAIVVGQKIYFYQSPDAEPKEIYKAKGNNPSIALSNNGKIFVYYSGIIEGHKESFENNDSKQGQGEFKSYIVDSNDGSPIEFGVKDNGVVDFAAWAPDSNKLFYQTSSSLLWNKKTGNSNVILNVRPTNPASVTWIDNDNFLYIDQGAIWQMNTNDGISTKLANSQGEVSSALPFGLSTFNKDIYYGTSQPGLYGSNGTIYKFNFNE